MKNRFKISHLWLLTLLIAIVSCNNDDDGTIEINVEDLTVTIDENPTNGETIGTIETSGNGTPSFSISAQNPTGALSIEASTGELTVADASVFDFETNPIITATVAVAGATDDANVTVTLNNLPELGVQDLTIAIDENPMDGVVLGTMQVNGSGTSSFSIDTQAPAGALSIDQNSGELTVADATLFDFETNPVITATVSVVDGTDPAIVTINLNNVSELTLEDLTVSIDENPTNGDLIGTVLVTGNGSSSFSLDMQTPSGALAIDQNTGELTVADATLFDFETNPVITGTVAVVDGINTATVTINLSDVVELTLQDLTVSIDENPTDGQVVGTMQASGSGTLSFSITTQTPTGALAIASTGELTVVDPNLFDFETNPVITAAVSVTDGAETATATATVNLNDVDEVSAQNTDLTIDENPSNGDVIGTLQASGSNLTYTITFQNPAGAFSINQSTGELSVADETLFDFETNPNMLATISVSNGTQTVSANAFVALNDVNELGEVKYGGMIFWIDPADNSNGLVFAFNNQLNNLEWGCSGTITGALGTAIGTGAFNTSTIVSAGCGIGGAAAMVENLNINGFQDWFLPSFLEMNEISTNYSAILWPAIQANGGSALISSNWTSTEDNGVSAVVSSISGQTTTLPKTVTLSAIPVRAF